MNWFKMKETPVYSPVIGKLIPLEKVDDPVFSTRMMGPGFAVIPKCGEIFSPISGKITSIFPTKHAIGLSSKDGKYEIMLHLGIDTVELKGEGFEVHVSKGDYVKINQKLITLNLAFLKENDKQDTIITVFPGLGKVIEIEEKEIFDRSNSLFSL